MWVLILASLLEGTNVEFESLLTVNSSGICINNYY